MKVVVRRDEVTSILRTYFAQLVNAENEDDVEVYLEEDLPEAPRVRKPRVKRRAKPAAKAKKPAAAGAMRGSHYGRKREGHKAQVKQKTKVVVPMPAKHKGRPKKGCGCYWCLKRLNQVKKVESVPDDSELVRKVGMGDALDSKRADDELRKESRWMRKQDAMRERRGTMIQPTDDAHVARWKNELLEDEVDPDD